MTWAYVDAGVRLAPTGRGPLTGLRFAVKDVFDIEGRVTGAGCPAYAEGRGPAERTAPVILRLIAAGAELRGVTVTEELMFGVLGQSGTGEAPPNPKAPDRLPGGSSSGSASAVAAGLCDVALGTDTGGSVRVPASFCGIYGLRTGWGRVPATGVVPLAPRFDTVGWFAREAAVLEAVTAVLLPEPVPAQRDKDRLWLPAEVLEGLEPALARMIARAAEEAAEALGLALERRALGVARGDWGRAYKTLQGLATWAVHGPWLREMRPDLGPIARRRFEAAAAVDPAEGPGAEAVIRRLTAAVLPALDAGAVLVMPTTPGPAPRRDAVAAALEPVRAAILERTALAGLLGLAELSLPSLAHGGAPVGLSLVGHGWDERRLVAMAARLAPALGREKVTE
ncbi:amidase [Histidinibacterium lentulum]|uniref:Amidase n=1 Tax=Histidinibacterium lentulum TaxID=2480588 RepID=A0A3N2R8D7_9RHOB|nr:amidase [Histidinibacterium lentulum]ROU03683.1 amidase [Histidinibacterium lentulum]